MSVVQLREISLQYDRIKVLDDFNLSVEVGEYIVVVGASGCGKTSLLKIIAGLVQPSAGQVLVAGKDVRSVAPRNRDVTLVPQHAGLYPHLSIGRSIELGIRERLPRRERLQRVEDAARVVEMERLLDRRPDQLSGGQLRRAAVAKAVASKAAIRLLDEPLSAIDAGLRFQIESDLRRLHRQSPGVTIHVTHDGAEAIRLADRVAFIEGGRVIQCDRPEVMVSRPATPRVAAALGQSRFFTIEMRRADDSWGIASPSHHNFARSIDGPPADPGATAELGFFQSDILDLNDNRLQPGDWSDDSENILVRKAKLYWFLD